MRFALAAAASLALVAGGLGAGVAQAESAPGCSSTVQIGSTAYGSYQGQDAISVKQFKGCGQNWSYIYVWQSFRDRHISYRAHASVYVQFDGGMSWGDVDKSGSPVEVWSEGTNTLDSCTAASGYIQFGSDSTVSAKTGWRC
ncbi:hypothetical protein [Kutzneria buriramensis]|uniref:Peptidase inhibitor family I36 n=1 Tax=Kutzneria buriramensis TaxID=1045776 RepID=A0A3E0I617_9PSEU|nr:hypothetical protein [Kutzneria buriramensis]REH54050.1 hypothetical protein BCF44_102282 [Kutzneria buriramensis]